MKQLLISLCLLMLPVTAVAGEIDEKCGHLAFYGAPVSKNITNSQQICRTNWAAHYVYSIKGTEYVIEHIELNDVNGASTRKDDFRADPAVPAKYRAELTDYAGAGYDRGHLSPAAANTQSDHVMSESFFLTNMVPQVPNLNRGVWLRLELRVRDLVRNHGKQLYVVNGAVYGDHALSIGNGVAVPTQMFKVIVDPVANKGIAFIFPNALETKISQSDLLKYATSIKEVERITGLNFHPNLPRSLQHLENEFNISDWPVFSQ
jgi:endonuclease G